MKVLIGIVSALLMVTLISSSVLYAKAEDNKITDFESNNDEIVVDNSEVQPEIAAQVARGIGRAVTSGAVYDGVKWVAQNTKNKGKPDYSKMQQTGYACYGLKSEDDVAFKETPEFAR